MTLDEDRLNHSKDSFLKQLQEAQHKLTLIESNAKNSSREAQVAQAVVINELSTALEELHVATEEIQAQSEELALTRQSLEKEHHRYQQLFELAPDGYLVTTTHGVIQEVNSSAENLLNLRREQMMGKPFIVFVTEADRFQFHVQLNHLATSECLTNWEVILKPRNRGPFPASVSISSIRDPQGIWTGLRWIIRDISAHQQAQKMYHDAFHDNLTGLANRALLLDRLGHLLEQYQRHPEQLFALLFLDLDRFKSINDGLGHLAGDQALIEMASRLKTCVRREDTLARLGGDEFVILLEKIRHFSEAEACALRIQEALAIPFPVMAHEISIKASIGIVLSDPHYIQPTELLRDADLAMYQAKRQGGNCYQIFSSQMHQETLDAFVLEQELHQAIQEQEFEVHFQPIVLLSTQLLKGFEALVRWRHPHRGLLSPLEFLPVAHDTGLIVLIDLWMMNAACQQMAAWIAEFKLPSPLTVSVNVSGRLFTQADFAIQLQSILQRTGLDPKCLTLEITESVITENIEQATAILNRLRALGVQLTIDDFGTGYSSLSRLQSLPFDGLKIDRSFLSKDAGIEMVSAIVLLAHTLGLYVITEGVELAAQANKLREIECEYAQGYYFGCPEDSELTKLKIGVL